MNMSGYQQYKQQSVNTMTQGELLMLLYDELLKRLLRGQLCLEKKEYEIFQESITRCVDIVRYLKDTLNLDIPISLELNRMYDFFIYELSRVQASRDVKIILEVRPLIQELRDTFNQVQKMSNY